MDVTINGTVHQLPASTSLDQAVALITQARSVAAGAEPPWPPRGVAAAVNGDVVPAAAWPSLELAAGDQVEVLTAVQGG